VIVRVTLNEAFDHFLVSVKSSSFSSQSSATIFLLRRRFLFGGLRLPQQPGLTSPAPLSYKHFC
jgi:hypothetical protein